MVPALMVSPGPSLRRNWNEIADLEGFDGPLIFGARKQISSWPARKVN
jgi:hypothetical protein